MLILNRKELEKYDKPYRLWQGISSIEVSDNGRIFITYFSGSTKEDYGNYTVLEQSDDGGNTFSIIAVVDNGKRSRAFDPSLWIDPLNRLWWNSSCIEKDDFYVGSVIVENIDGVLKFNKPRHTVYEIMLNKPTVYSKDGSWLFPATVWDIKYKIGIITQSSRTDRTAGLFVSKDNGETFERRCGIEVPQRAFDEHMFVEQKDHSIAMYSRTHYGISKCVSYDGGYTFSKPCDSGFGGPDSRFHIRTLKSGRLLLINHYNFKNRDHLYAMLSEDDGKTWPYKLLLDERDDISYPDAKEAKDGYIYICYDHERGFFKSKFEDCIKCAREILLAKITEEEIINGSISNENSFLKKVINKLGEYKGNEKGLFSEFEDKEIIEDIVYNFPQEEGIHRLFRNYNSCLVTLSDKDRKELDATCEQYVNPKNKDDIALLMYLANKIFRFLTNTSWKPETEDENFYITERVRKFVDSELDCPELRLEYIANKLNISKFYLSHIFKDVIKTPVAKYVLKRRIACVKDLIVNSDFSFFEIGQKVGIYDYKYLSKWFKKNCGMTMRQYKKQNK